MLMIEGLAEKYIIELSKEISTISKRILHEFPVEFYIDDMKSYPELCSYDYISPELKAVFKNIIWNYDGHTLALYHKLAISTFIKDSVDALKRKNFPHTVLPLYKEWFERVLKEFSSQPNQYYDHNNDAFLKDLAGCNLRVIPVGGAWVVEISGTGRRFLFCGGPRQFMDGVRFVLFKTGDFKPFYLIHTVDRYLDGFNPEERDKCYLRIAELLKLNTRIRGFIQCSWYYDPVLESISPRLAYYRLRPEQNGAKLFRIGTTESDIKNATAKSPTRRKLYKEGKYVPTSYLEIWPRKELIEWADEQSRISRRDQI